MYVLTPNAMDDEPAVRRFVATVGSAELISVGPDGYPMATRLPIVWTGDRVLAHFARANPHWRALGSENPVLLVVSGAEAYVSPTWYPSKREHGRVVPTWNYSAVQLRGRARVHEDVEWLRAVVTELVDVHEHLRAVPWALTDAPARFVDGQLRGIVGVEIAVESFVGKAKLSQNRSEADRLGVIDGLGAEGSAGAHEVARLMGQQQ